MLSVDRRAPVAGASGLDLPAREAELEALAEGRATAAQREEDYIIQTLAKLDHSHNQAFTPGTRIVDTTPAKHAHPNIIVHGVHGCCPATQSRSDIEAKLESIDQARKLEKKRILEAGQQSPVPVPVTPPEPADESILRILALRKLQLLQLHLKSDNLPILVRPATATHGNLYLGSVGVSHHLPNLLAHNITHILSVGRNLAQPFPEKFQYLYIPMLDSSTTKITQDVYETSWKFVEEARTGKPVTTSFDLSSTNSTNTELQGSPPAVRPTNSVNDQDTNLPVIRSVAQRSSAAAENSILSTSLSKANRDEGAIQSARRSSPGLGNVLVHCFAGKSRSTTILLSYLMYSEGWSLDAAYAHVKQCRPTINPNPGFLTQLKDLERQLFAPANSAPAACAPTTPLPANATIAASSAPQNGSNSR